MENERSGRMDLEETAASYKSPSAKNGLRGRDGLQGLEYYYGRRQKIDGIRALGEVRADW